MTEATSVTSFDAIEREYAVYFMQRFPVVATYLGGSNFDSALADVDGGLRDYSAVGLATENHTLRWYKERFASVHDESLSARRRIDKRVALAQIDFLIHQYQVRRYQQRALDSYVEEPFCGVEWQIQSMGSTGPMRCGTEEEWSRVFTRVRAIPTYFEVARNNIESGIAAKNTPDWRILMQSGLHGSSLNANYFRQSLPAIAKAKVFAGDHSGWLADFITVCHAASDAYLKFRDYLVQTFFDDAARGDNLALKEEFRDNRYAMGANEYDWALRNNLRLGETAVMLYEKSWPIVERTRREVIVLARAIAEAREWPVAGDDLETVALVFERLSSAAPKTDAQMLESYREVGVRLVEYGRVTTLFDIPENYRLEVTETPPVLRSGLDAAAYFPAPPFKSGGTGRFYINPTGDNAIQLKQQHNQHAVAYLAAHEGFPGHDWHYKVMSRHREYLSPIRWLTPGGVCDSSSMWGDSMAAEGWALYAEGLLAEPRPGAPTGFYSSEERLYQLRGLLYRKLRVHIDTGLHLGKLGFDEAVSLYSQTVDFLPGDCDDEAPRSAEKCASCQTARAAIARYSRWPTQAITYSIGRDEILALRTRARKELGNRFSEQQFHLEFMKQGAIAASYFADELIDVLKRREGIVANAGLSGVWTPVSKSCTQKSE